jgi:hypothetical protein
MSTMVIERALLEQVLEALDREIDTRRCKASTLRAMIALRGALAHQAEPVEATLGYARKIERLTAQRDDLLQALEKVNSVASRAIKAAEAKE